MDAPGFVQRRTRHPSHWRMSILRQGVPAENHFAGPWPGRLIPLRSSKPVLIVEPGERNRARPAAHCGHVCGGSSGRSAASRDLMTRFVLGKPARIGAMLGHPPVNPRRWDRLGHRTRGTAVAFGRAPRASRTLRRERGEAGGRCRPGRTPGQRRAGLWAPGQQWQRRAWRCGSINLSRRKPGNCPCVTTPRTSTASTKKPGCGMREDSRLSRPLAKRANATCAAPARNCPLNLADGRDGAGGAVAYIVAHEVVTG